MGRICGRAAGTAEGQAQKRGAGNGEHIVEFVVALLFDLVFGDLRGVRSRAEEARRHERQRVLRRELVACDLPAHELIVGRSELSVLMTKSR